MSYATLRSKIEQLIEKAQSGVGGNFAHIRYSNDGGKTILTHNPLCPIGYTQVEYLESTGTQYINTNWVYKPNSSKFEIVYRYEASNTSSGFGFRNPNIKNAVYQVSDNIYIADDIGYSAAKGSTVAKYKQKIEYEGDTLTINGTPYTQTRVVAENNLPMYLFCLNENGKPAAYKNDIKIYSFKGYDNGILTVHLTPCVRDADGVAGMYDSINGVFLTNGGSGVFTVGEVIFPKFDYIGVCGNNAHTAPSDASAYTWEPTTNYEWTYTMPEAGGIGGGIEIGENLANPDGIILNKYLSGDGREIVYNNWSISDYIPVDSSKIYSIVPIGINNQYSEFYDENKQYLSGISSSAFIYEVFFSKLYCRAFKCPEGAKYVRFSQTTANIQALGVYEVQGEL